MQSADEEISFRLKTPVQSISDDIGDIEVTVHAPDSDGFDDTEGEDDEPINDESPANLLVDPNRSLAEQIREHPEYQHVLDGLVKDRMERNSGTARHQDKEFTNVSRPTETIRNVPLITSLSESTIYAPALNQLNSDSANVIDKISNFVEEVRIETGRRQTPQPLPVRREAPQQALTSHRNR